MTLDIERERTIQVLCSHYAHDHLTTQELEQRCERAYAAREAVQLTSLIADLPQLPAPVDAVRLQTLTDSFTEPERLLAFMSGVRRAGEWRVPPALRVKAIMGNVILDLRSAVLPAATRIDVSSIMSEVTILVSPFVRVEATGGAIMGEFDHRSGSMVAATTTDAPLIRVTGRATLGAVRIKTRLPNESALEAWRRERRLRSGS